MVKSINNSSYQFTKSICYGVPNLKLCKARVDYMRYICKWEEVLIINLTKIEFNFLSKHLSAKNSVIKIIKNIGYVLIV